jgi:hypothetical protein
MQKIILLTVLSCFVSVSLHGAGKPQPTPAQASFLGSAAAAAKTLLGAPAKLAAKGAAEGATAGLAPLVTQVGDEAQDLVAEAAEQVRNTMGAGAAHASNLLLQLGTERQQAVQQAGGLVSQAGITANSVVGNAASAAQKTALVATGAAVNGANAVVNNAADQSANTAARLSIVSLSTLAAGGALWKLVIPGVKTLTDQTGKDDNNPKVVQTRKRAWVKVISGSVLTLFFLTTGINNKGIARRLKGFPASLWK